MILSVVFFYSVRLSATWSDESAGLKRRNVLKGVKEVEGFEPRKTGCSIDARQQREPGETG
jgi:hypothetical protein